jgi:ABC-type sulfate/molybdate transport systems ATPase subunit
MVTHDPEDALAIATTVAILDQGRVLQTGTPTEVYCHPVNQYCAERFGPANRVIDPLTGAVTWRRPEEARWISCEIADEGSPVIVESVRPLGHVYEVRVREEESGVGWLCFLKEAVGICPGTRGRIAWRGAPDPVSWKS